MRFKTWGGDTWRGSELTTGPPQIHAVNVSIITSPSLSTPQAHVLTVQPCPHSWSPSGVVQRPAITRISSCWSLRKHPKGKKADAMSSWQWEGCIVNETGIWHLRGRHTGYAGNFHQHHWELHRSLCSNRRCWERKVNKWWHFKWRRLVVPGAESTNGPDSSPLHWPAPTPCTLPKVNSNQTESAFSSSCKRHPREWTFPMSGNENSPWYFTELMTVDNNDFHGFWTVVQFWVFS